MVGHSSHCQIRGEFLEQLKLNRVRTFAVLLALIGSYFGPVPSATAAFAPLAPCVGDVTISSQAEADLFNCSAVSGNLFVWNSTDLANLDGLSVLGSVGESLRIQSNPLLTDIDGLSALTSVGPLLIIRDNALLTDLDGLSSLTNVDQTPSSILSSIRRTQKPRLFCKPIGPPTRTKAAIGRR
jgi:hypothetical protein